MEQAIAKLKREWSNRLLKLQESIQSLQSQGLYHEAMAVGCSYDMQKACLQDLEERFPQVELTPMSWTAFAAGLRQSE